MEGVVGVEGADGRVPPLGTESTLRPEGGRRAAPGDAPAPARQWPVLAVLAVTAAGLLITLASFRAGLLVVGAAMLLGGVLRAVVRNVGMLAVRSRFTDVITLGVLGLGIVVLALMSMPGPVLHLSWLTGALHFTVR